MNVARGEAGDTADDAAPIQCRWRSWAAKAPRLLILASVTIISIRIVRFAQQPFVTPRGREPSVREQSHRQLNRLGHGLGDRCADDPRHGVAYLPAELFEPAQEQVHLFKDEMLGRPKGRVFVAHIRAFVCWVTG